MLRQELAAMNDTAMTRGKNEMAEYHAHYSHDGRNWVVQFTDPDISTYGRTLAQAKRYAREALAVWLDLSSVDELESHGVAVLDLVELPGGMSEDVSQLREQRATAEHLRHEVATRTANAARRLLAAGWSTRDIAAALDVSAGYVSKLARGQRAS
jgi:hypothetical protein